MILAGRALPPKGPPFPATTLGRIDMPAYDICACGTSKRTHATRCRRCYLGSMSAGRTERMRENGGRKPGVHDRCACGEWKVKSSARCWRCSGHGGGSIQTPRARINHQGYVELWRPDHPVSRRNGRVLEHRLVLHDAGIKVPPGNHVHHRNGDKTDNRLENLEVLAAAEHVRGHAAKRGVIRNQYGTWPVKFTDGGAT